MITRNELLSEAIHKCMKELYLFAKPSVSWDKFVEENKIYSNKYKEWEKYKDSDEKTQKEYDEKLGWKDKSITECIGPRPYEFYYLPKDIMKDICDSYVHAYRLDSQQELLNTIEILKNYCKEPIIDKYIEGENGFPGHRGYEHPDNLEKELRKIIKSAENIPLDKKESYEKSYNKLIEDVQNKFFEFLDMAGDFYNWNGELNSFNTSVYLGASPYSNKNAVIDNWKKYRNIDIEIDEEQIKKDYYGEELD